MVNSYCDSLNDTFAQLVYYGVLEEDDAQCFSVRSSIEGGSLILAGGALALAIINTFVTKAVLQYFRDRRAMEERAREDIEKMSQPDSDNTSDTSSDDPLAADQGFSANIQPVPVLFTDNYRWLLRQENSLPTSARALFVDPSSDEHWALPEATAVPLDGIRDEHSLASEKAEMNQSMSAVSKSALPQKSRRLSQNDDSQSKLSKRSTSQMSQSSSRRSVTSHDDTASVYSMPSLTDDQEASRRSSVNGGGSVAGRSTGGASMEYSATSSRHTPHESFGDEASAPQKLQRTEVDEDQQSAPSTKTTSARDEAIETGTNDGSLYYEETVDGDFEEYTVDSLGDIAEEEEYYEEVSNGDDTRSGSRELI